MIDVREVKPEPKYTYDKTVLETKSKHRKSHNDKRLLETEL